MRFWICCGWMFALVVRAACGGESTLETLGQQQIEANGGGELHVEIVDADAPRDSIKKPPARIIVTASDGSHPDGSGRGVYADGRFFAEGEFTVKLPAGDATLHVASGPHVVPLAEKVHVPADRRVLLRARLQRWLAPQSMGWFCGDNHVHTQHDAKTTVRADPSYTALQARANDLSFITEADAEISSKTAQSFDAPGFLYRAAPEIRPGPFVGHLNTPGIAHALAPERYEQCVRGPLPCLRLHDAVRELGGAMIHTHPLTPPHQLHWMGAGEAWSDAAIGRCCDLVDIDLQGSEQLWYAMLNLGNRVGCSSYTDCALGRLQTPSPGDRRVYCKADKLDYAPIVEAMRKGRTIATSGGPLLVEMTIGGGSIGDVLTVDAGQRLPLHVECHSLLTLGNVELYSAGKRIRVFDLTGRTGRVVIDDQIVANGEAPQWYVVRAENRRGDWAVTSPIYAEPRQSREANPVRAAALLLEISNHTRFIELRKEFFAHLIVTVRPPEAIDTVHLLNGGVPTKSFQPSDGDQWHEGRVPVTQLAGEYGPGWAWHREAGVACHLQADWPVKETGWYCVEVSTSSGRRLRSDEIRFDAADRRSHALSLAHLEGPSTRLTLRGYGEEMQLDQIPKPFVGDHWWYPNNSFWTMRAHFDGDSRELHGGDAKAAQRFRESSLSPGRAAGR